MEGEQQAPDPQAVAAIRDFAARVDARAGGLIQAGRARNAHYFAMREELALLETPPPAAAENPASHQN